MNSSQLSSEVIEIISSPNNSIYVSVVSIWEIGFKQSINKLIIPENILEIIENNNFKILQINAEHTMLVHKLPYHHTDLFDRLLIAQANCENMKIITQDEKFIPYEIPLVKI